LENLIRKGLIEFLDINEQNNALISSDFENLEIKTSHIEITPEIIMGISGNLIPFSDHNQSPRNTYQCAMGKQAIGSISYNQNQRCDTVLSILSYPQKPLVKTKTVYFSGNNRLSSGINACICIMSFSGYDIEDSIILNRSSTERGFFRSVVMRKHKILMKNFWLEQKRSILENIKYLNEEKDLKTKNKTTSKESSLIFLNSFQNNFFDLEKFIFSQLSPREFKGEMIEKIIVSSNFRELFFVKLIIRQIRKPEVGDKFSSRHGQKGICGFLCFQKDIPFSNDGVVPDLIMNPHGFPSRMTIGKMLEILNGKFGTYSGNFKDGTAFVKKEKKFIYEKLKKLGFNPKGNEHFFSGVSGQFLAMEIFSGPVFYQKLKHMVKDKIHARSRGPRSVLTKQPIEGRSREGGQRFGEMERDCLISYGSSDSIIERLLFSSDLLFIDFDLCTGLSTYGKKRSNIVSIRIPYACKLLFQELHSMNILPRLIFEKTHNNNNAV
jgi:DNA-directed RNA polymerase III subunit RPC2